MRRHDWNDSVSSASQAVQPIGHPISHSTQAGFNSPPLARIVSVNDVPGFAFDPGNDLDPDRFASPTVGVGIITAACRGIVLRRN